MAKLQDLLSSRICTALAGADIDTVARLEHWAETNGPEALENIDGIGPGFRQEIERVLDELAAEKPAEPDPSVGIGPVLGIVEAVPSDEGPGSIKVPWNGGRISFRSDSVAGDAEIHKDRVVRFHPFVVETGGMGAREVTPVSCGRCPHEIAQHIAWKGEKLRAVCWYCAQVAEFVPSVAAEWSVFPTPDPWPCERCGRDVDALDSDGVHLAQPCSKCRGEQSEVNKTAAEEAEVDGRPASAKEALARRGTVKWYSNPKGYGFIAREGGEDVFVHYSETPDEEGLREGQLVEFVVEETKKGPKATRVAVVEADDGDDPGDGAAVPSDGELACLFDEAWELIQVLDGEAPSGAKNALGRALRSSEKGHAAAAAKFAHDALEVLRVEAKAEPVELTPEGRQPMPGGEMPSGPADEAEEPKGVEELEEELRNELDRLETDFATFYGDNGEWGVNGDDMERFASEITTARLFLDDGDLEIAREFLKRASSFFQELKSTVKALKPGPEHTPADSDGDDRGNGRPRREHERRRMVAIPA